VKVSCLALGSQLTADAPSLVSLDGLKRAYEILQLGGTDDTDAIDPSDINVEAHFSAVDSFDMPAQHFDIVRSGFTLCASTSTL
jgi:DNA polymerase epsilon subunit 2